MNCPICQSTDSIKKGTTELASGIVKQRYRCKSCNNHYSVVSHDDSTDDMFEDDFNEEETPEQLHFERSPEWLQSNVYSSQRIVVTAAQNNTPLDPEFFETLQNYCYWNNASLLAIPIKHKTVTAQDDDASNAYDDEITPYLCENTLEFPKYNLKIYAGLKIQATAENPLAGLDPLSKGNSIIVGHAQVQLKTMPNLDKRISDIITTTGAITQKNYSKTKLGEKAKFNHSMSALVIEFDATTFHLRHLNWDPVTRSFWDLDTCYHLSEDPIIGEVTAIVTGDEHAVFRDSMVENHTYLNEDSLVNSLRPEYIVRHDSLDAYAISHHHKKNVFTQYAKWKSGMNSIESELQQTVDYINDTTPEFSRSIIVQSNHNEHLLRWLNEIDIKSEPWNAKLYHYLMYQMLEQTEMGEAGTSHPDPFELIATPWLNENVEFASRSGFKIKGIEVGQHGDRGTNGARGSAVGFARIPDKMIVGHSHSPQINKGCYVVGTSSRLALEYNSGPSTWHHAHCIIHQNGKRQMVFITKDGWRLN